MASALGLALALSGFVASARSAASTGAFPAPGAVTVAAEPFVVGPSIELHPASGTAIPGPTADPARGVPLRLVVRSLRIDVPVVPIDAPGGVLVPPSNPQTVGWWRSGAKPGAAHGSALIAGHTVSDGRGAFDDLDTLRRGDLLSVSTTHGRIGYRVTGVTVYRKASLAEDARRVFSQSVPGRLVLITCEDWNGAVYLSNALVFAELVQASH